MSLGKGVERKETFLSQKREGKKGKKERRGERRREGKGRKALKDHGLGSRAS